MPENRTQKWRQLFEKNCKHWEDGDKLRYFNIPNDRDDIDEEELKAARELIEEINRRPPSE